MPASDRAFDRGTRQGDRALGIVATEFRQARIGAGVSQDQVSAAAHVSRSRYSKIERGKAKTLTLLEAARIASVLGLDMPVRLYPAADPLRDGGHSERLERLVAHVRRPLTHRREVPLPALPDRTELRAWDLMLFGHGERTAVELEMRLHDGQAAERRIALKRRDDPTEQFLLAIADTRTNRRVLAEHPGLFADLARLRAAAVCAALETGRHPSTGLVLI